MSLRETDLKGQGGRDERTEGGGREETAIDSCEEEDNHQWWSGHQSVEGVDRDGMGDSTQ